MVDYFLKYKKMDKHKEYILHLVKDEKVDPSSLLRTTKSILEDYVESITDSTLRPVLYNTTYGGYGLSVRFREFQKISDDDYYYEDRDCYYEIIDGFGNELLKDPDLKKEYLAELMKQTYGMDTIKCYVDNVHTFQKRIQIVKDFIAQGKFGPDNECPFRNLDNESYLWNTTKSYAQSVLKEIEESYRKDNDYYKRLHKYNKELYRDYEDIFEKLCEFYELYRVNDENMLNKFDIQNMKWIDPLKNEECEIDADIFEKVKVTIALKEASGEYCKLDVVWIPKNRDYNVHEYDGLERISQRSVLSSK